MVREEARMAGMSERDDMVSVGWQWASHIGRCQGKGSWADMVR